MTAIPYAAGSDTSQHAATSMQPHTPHMHQTILQLLDTHGPLTCDHIEHLTGWKHQTTSARLWELTKTGIVEDSGQRSRTRSGRTARLYRRTRTTRWTDRYGIKWQCDAYDHGPMCRQCRLGPA